MIESKLAELGLTLPEAPKPIAAYVPAVQAGNLLLISGQLPLRDGQLVATGAVPDPVAVEAAQDAARQCVLNGMAILRDHIDGDWSKVQRIARLGVFVQSVDGFGGQPQVANGASELVVELFGETGKHARAAVGVNALPLDATVEIEFTIALQ